MKKSLAIILFSILLCILFICPVCADSIPLYSIAAFDEYCEKWNEYYTKANPWLNGSYFLSDDEQDIGACLITYNEDHFRANYPSGIIPNTASVMVMFMPAQARFLVSIMDDTLKSDLQSIVIYNKDNKTITPEIINEHDLYDAWTISIWPSELLELYDLDVVRIDLVVNGKKHNIEINTKSHSFLYKMLDWQFGGFVYATNDSENFKDKDMLPAEKSATTSSGSGQMYSFRDDVNAMNEAAKSVFFVEIYDDNLLLLGTASGFVAFDEHLFVTNQHVIEGASFLRIIDDSEDENKYILNQVIASNKQADLAILLFPEGKQYNSLELNTNEDFQRGQPVVAIGSPEGLKNSLSKGDISAIREENGIKLIQFSASISHGSSGGALFDNNGKVIGVTSGAITEGQNLNFAISIRAVQDLYNQWNKRDYEKLGTKKSWDMTGNNLLGIITKTNTPQITTTPKPTLKPSATPTPKTTQIFGIKPLVTATPKPTKTSTPKPTKTPTPKPTKTPTPKPTKTPTPKPTATPKPTPSPTSTPNVVNYGADSKYKIVLDESEITIYKGIPVSIKPNVIILETNQTKQNIKYSWNSSNPNIAEFVNGRIIGNSVGDAVLSCKLIDDESVFTLLFIHVAEPVTSVSVVDESIELICNDSTKNVYQIKPSFEPKSSSFDELNYSSSNSKVVEVDNSGKVKAVSAGNASIKITISIKGTTKVLQKNIKVRVIKKVTKISGIDKTYNLMVNKTLQLSPKVEPSDATNKKVIWESSKESIATVNASGVIKGIKPGSATITAKAADTGKALASCTVTVIQPVTSIKDTNAGSSYPFRCEVGSKVNYSSLFTIEPSNASNKNLDFEVKLDNKVVGSKYYKLEESNVAFSVIRSITFLQKGLYSVKATTKDGSNKSVTVKVRVYPKDMMTLSFGSVYSTPLANDKVSLVFDISNADYGISISAFEIYVYATDTWGNKIYGETVYYGTTEKTVGPGKTVKSEKFVIPQWSKVSKLYCAIHKIKLNDNAGTVKTYKNPDYVYYTFNK